MTEAYRNTVERNKAICDYYNAGHKLRECASKFQLGRQRILQILQAGGAWKPYVKTDRTKYIGVNVSEDTKVALKELADAEGKSVSKFTADVLDRVVAEGEVP